MVNLNTNSKEYWKRRLTENAQNAFNISNATMQEQLRKIYTGMNDTMVKEIDDIYYRYLMDEISRTDIWTYKHYRDLSKRINILAAKVGAKEEYILNHQLETALKGIYKESNTPGHMTTNFSMLNETLVKQLVNRTWSGDHFSSRIWANKELLVKHLKKCITETIVLGKGKDKCIKNIMRTCQASFSNADRLVRTELMHTINEGQRQRYKDNGYTKLEIVVADDERLCEHCGARDGTVIGIDDGGAYPPFHPRCRCTIIPVIDWGD